MMFHHNLDHRSSLGAGVHWKSLTSEYRAGCSKIETIHPPGKQRLLTVRVVEEVEEEKSRHHQDGAYRSRRPPISFRG